MESSLQIAVERFLSQSVYSSAVFLAERLVAEHASEENISLLAQAYYRSGEGHRAIVLLQRPKCTSISPQNQYLLALCCYEAGRLAEAESALIPIVYPKIGAAIDMKARQENHIFTEIPNGAAGLYLMACICRRASRIKHAIQYFKLR